ncbi:uncharacterized protein [Elaeis guineensis]|uniref:Uncharacterized protein LOC105056860 n=1 Tax=Elaeis guineensis var. tenera TaxID=51953 RepID=A0A6I9S4E7_ELAGV|nr:uncharacterized protein LOC105056860 [Elaeis guineensis]XP_010937496.1 uncharacterized protein LOC105056860 [Elaeis guineensis]XP_029123868.1 uncharacterized protein LOC105056860 [Elaeis guineensis]
MASSQEAMSKLRVGRTTEYRMGTDTRLLTIDHGPTELFVLCTERFEAAPAFRSGDFSMHMIRVKGNPMAMVICMVGDHQWMLAKDSLVLHVEARMFVFVLPGFLYGLTLPTTASDHESRIVEEIFKRFCAYRDLSANEDCESGGDSNSETDPWARAYSKMEKLTSRKTVIAAANSAKTPPETTAGVSSADPNTRRKLQRAVRTSAVVKLLSRALLAGALDPTKHLHLVAATAAGGAALPTMWALADLLDAVEAGKQRIEALPLGQRGPQGSSGWWTLNREGARRLLEVVWACGATRGVKRTRVEAVEEEEEEDSNGGSNGITGSNGRCRGGKAKEGGSKMVA